MASHLMDSPDVLKKIAAYKVDEVADLKTRTTIAVSYTHLRAHETDS